MGMDGELMLAFPWWKVETDSPVDCQDFKTHPDASSLPNTSCFALLRFPTAQHEALGLALER